MKLLDFGIAKVVQDAQKAAGSFTKTPGSVTSFTPAYGAPEQFIASHGATGPWTDVFCARARRRRGPDAQPPLEGDDFVQLGFASANPASAPDAAHARRAGHRRGRGRLREGPRGAASSSATQSAGEFWNALREALHMKPMRALMAGLGPALAIPSGPRASPTANTLAVSVVAVDRQPRGGRRQVTASPAPRRNGLLMMRGGRRCARSWAAWAAFVLMINGKRRRHGRRPRPARRPRRTRRWRHPTPTCPKGMIYDRGRRVLHGLERRQGR